jgi:hypothetical protein
MYNNEVYTGEKNDATSIPPKLTTDFMLIMLLSSAVFIPIQLKHVQLCFSLIFQTFCKRLFRELPSSVKNASAISEKKFCSSIFTRNTRFSHPILIKLDTYVVSVTTGSILNVFIV